MANAKSRLKSQTIAKKNGHRGRPKKVTKVLSTAKSETNEKMVETDVNKRRTVLTPNEKISLMLQSGHELKDKFIKSPPIASDGKIDKSALSIVKNQIINKRGTIKKKSKDHLNLLDSILMSELMITDMSRPKKKKTQQLCSSMADQRIDNNNCDEISDQNRSESDRSTDKLNSAKKVKQTKDKESTVKSKKQQTSKHKQKVPKTNAKLSNDNEELARQNSKLNHGTLSDALVLTLELFQCDYCKKSFKTKSSLRRHIYMHLDIKPHACRYCKRRFRQMGNLRAHLSRKHHKEYSVNQCYMCNQCDKIFLLKENLNLHLASHVKHDNQFQCVYCEKKFSHNQLLVKHEKKHLVSGRFQCTICKMSYECRSRLALHVKSHLNIKEYVCQYCGKEFLRQNSIRRHVEISHGGQRIQCPICKKKLRGHLTEHLRTHDKKRPHKCPECGARFTQSTQLTVHRRSHSGARPYPCRICLRPFTHSNALMLHIRRHTGEKPFDCPMCPLAFSQLPHMKAHMKKIHGKDLTYKCGRCSQFFKLKTQLESHAKSCRSGKPAPPPPTPARRTAPAPAAVSGVPGDPDMNLSRMRYLLALLFTMIVEQDKLKVLGFNKRLIDDLLEDSLEAMELKPCKDEALEALPRLKSNIALLLRGTVPKDKMKQFQKEKKTTEQLLVLLTDEKKKR